MKKNNEKKMLDIQNFLINQGFIFQGSSIYGGLANTWDYGPLGILLKNNIQKIWWNEFIIKEENNFGFDSKILMNPLVWKASGHFKNFNDPLIENKINGKRYRADEVIKSFDHNFEINNKTLETLENYLIKNVKKFDNSKTQWSKIRQFQLMFKTFQGVVENNKTEIFLRPEIAQGIFINFKNIQRTMRAKLPFGVGQIGKSFRNEVTPGNFIFRTREFEQMELEVFTYPQNANDTFDYYQKKINFFLKKLLGISAASLRIKEHSQKELAHYAKKTIDFEFLFPFGWGELLGLSNRGDFDLTQHIKSSGEDLTYYDSQKNQKIIPFVIEPSIGLDRLMLAILIEAYQVENIDNNNERVLLKLNFELAPYKLAILPLISKFHHQKAYFVFQELVKEGFLAIYDSVSSIGKRYRRQDAIGTPFCLTIDDETLKNNIATIRERDSMKQEKINLQDLKNFMLKKMYNIN